MSRQIVLSGRQAAKIVIDEAARLKPIVGAFHGVGFEAMQNLYGRGYRLVAWEGTLAYNESQPKDPSGD